MSYRDAHPDYEEIDLGDIRLIEPDLAHAAPSLTWISVDEVTRHMGADFSNPSHEGEVERIRKIIESPDRYSWMIECDGVVIGNTCINDIAEETEKAGVKCGGLSIIIGDPRYWKKGIATRVFTAVLDWAKTKGGFGAMHARALRENAGSRRTLEKLGFAETGTEPYEALVEGKPSVWHTYAKTL